MTIDELKAITISYWCLGGPYSLWAGGLADAALQACKIRGALVRAGVPNFSPIVHTHFVAMAAGIDPYDHTIWLPDDRPMATWAQGLLIADLAGWQASKGCRAEFEWFERRPRFLLDPTTLALASLDAWRD